MGFYILLFLSSSCPSLGALMLHGMVAFPTCFLIATNMIVTMDLDNILMRMPRSQRSPVVHRVKDPAQQCSGVLAWVAAVVCVGSLAQELPYITGVVKNKQAKKCRRKKRYNYLHFPNNSKHCLLLSRHIP